MIKDRNIAPGAGIGIDKLASPYIISGKHTDGSLPKILWVAKGGADSLSSAQGSRDEPYLTVEGTRGAMVQTVDGRGDRIIIGPGIYRANYDFGGGTGTTGQAGRMNKRDIGLFGSGGAHPGRTQIVSDGSTAGPTIRVRDGYLRGFIAADLEVGSVDSDNADRAQPFMDLETNDSAATLTADSSDEWATLRNLTFSGGGTGVYGLILHGVTMLRAYHLEFQGVVVGIMFRGSPSNEPENCYFEDIDFLDNVTADIGATGSHGVGQWPATPAFSTLDATNVRFVRARHLDRGGTPVTNYVNWGGGTGAGTTVNCGMVDATFLRDVADGTLLQIPADFTIRGWDPADGFISIIGA